MSGSIEAAGSVGADLMLESMLVGSYKRDGMIGRRKGRALLRRGGKLVVFSREKSREADAFGDQRRERNASWPVVGRSRQQQ